MRVYVGSDHVGIEYKREILKMLEDFEEYEGVECEIYQYDQNDDYNDAAIDVSKKVESDNGSLGILICGTGIGMSMSANRNKNIRAAVCRSLYEAEITRQHNDANVLCLGARVTDLELAKELVLKFLETKFSNEERHIMRVKRLGQCQ